MNPTCDPIVRSSSTAPHRIASVLAAAAAAATVLLGACNTVEGAGKDIEKGGEAIQRAAD